MYKEVYAFFLFFFVFCFFVFLLFCLFLFSSLISFNLVITIIKTIGLCASKSWLCKSFIYLTIFFCLINFQTSLSYFSLFQTATPNIISIIIYLCIVRLNLTPSNIILFFPSKTSLKVSRYILLFVTSFASL